MAQVIELPGEANPLSLQNVQNALALAASSTQQQVQTGAQQLQNWEKEENYYSFLQDVFLNYSVPVEVRSLAIIQLKNGIDKYWRKAATNAIKKEEKDQIKVRALEAGIAEPAPVLALQNALMIAKIMRYEFPTDWPDGIPTIISILRSSTQPGANPLHLPRTLLILLQIIKELSTARLARSRANLQSITPEIFHVLGGIYVERVNTWVPILDQGGADEATVTDSLEQQSLICLKVMRRLIIAGFEHPGRDKDVGEFWALTHSHFSKFLSFMHGPVIISEPIRKLVGKHLLQLTKLHVDMAKAHPASFALLPDSISLVKSYWALVVSVGEVYTKLGTDDESEWRSVMERMGLRALVLVRSCARMAFNPVRTFKYQTPKDKEERMQAVELIKSQLFTHDFVFNAMELLVTQFFRLTDSDFQEWEAEPEEWERKEDAATEAWEFSIRSCSERLFLDLIINFKEFLIPRLLSVFYSFARPDNRELLLKDALYSAIGLAVASIEQHLDFNAFVDSTLVAEVQIPEQGYNIIRRRIAIVIGQWVPVKTRDLNTTPIYQIFHHLLNKQDPLNDLVVRVTAARQLKNVLDPFGFSPEEFMPYAPSIFQNLMSLIEEVELAETKMGLLETIRVAVIKMEGHIAPFTDQILNMLPPLWEASGEEHLMKQAILTLLANIMYSLKEASANYHSLMLPLIRSSLDPNSDAVVYLIEEALELWGTIMSQTPAPASSEILSLLPMLCPIFQAATDCVPLALQIAESYILLAPQEVLNDQIRFHLLTSLEALLKSTTRARLGVVPHVVEMMIRCGDAVDGGSENTYNIIARSLVDSSFLSSLLQGLYSAYEVSESTGPNRKKSDVYGVVETDYFSVLARLALANPRIFASAVSAATGTSEEQTLSWILKEWFNHYDNIGSAGQKKLHTFGLTQILFVNGPGSQPPTYILNHLQSYLTIWTDMITELGELGEEHPDESSRGDYLVYWHKAPEQSDWEGTPETVRRRNWDNSDIIHNLNIRDYVRQRLRSLIVGCGGEQRFQEEWLVNVDRDVVSSFGALGLL